MEMLFFAIPSGLVVAYRIVDTLLYCWAVKHRKMADYPDSFSESLTHDYLLCFLFFSFPFFIILPTTCAISKLQNLTLLLFVFFCIISFINLWRNKLKSRQRWMNYFDEIIDGFFYKIDSVRTGLDRLFKYIQTHQKAMSIIPLLCVFVIMAFVLLTPVFPPLINICYLIAVILCGWESIASFYKALHSCRKLLILWIVGNLIVSYLLLSLLQSSLVWLTDITVFPSTILDFSKTSWFCYIGFTLIYTALWSLSAMLADDDCVKLATAIINTFMTLIIIIGNILCIIVNKASIQAEITSEQLQLILNLAVLPICTAGYISALSKEIQVYWKKRHRRPLPDDSKDK